MGGGDKPKDEDGSSADSPALILEAVAEFMKIPATKRELTVMAKVRARLQPDEERRAPITICAAIDRSGSMKEHLPLLKETLQFMMQQLRAEDKLSLITFDHEVNLNSSLFILIFIGSHACYVHVHVYELGCVCMYCLNLQNEPRLFMAMNSSKTA